MHTAEEILAVPGRARYLGDLKRALVGDESARLVFICNFEVERQWARGHQGLPAAPFSSAPQIVHRMEELGALLAGPDDFLILFQPLDRGFRDYARGLGLGLPTELIPESCPGGFLTTEAVLCFPAPARQTAGAGTVAGLPDAEGCSELEQKVAEATGLRLAGADAATAERVERQDIRPAAHRTGGAAPGARRML